MIAHGRPGRVQAPPGPARASRSPRRPSAATAACRSRTGTRRAPKTRQRRLRALQYRQLMSPASSLLRPAADERARVVAGCRCWRCPRRGSRCCWPRPTRTCAGSTIRRTSGSCSRRALTSAALAASTSGIALRRADARLFLVSLAFLAAAGFLALHALATPGVLLDTPNQGFVIATPVGCCSRPVFAALSALPLPPERASAVIRRAHGPARRAARGDGRSGRRCRWPRSPPLDDPTPAERATGGCGARPSSATRAVRAGRLALPRRSRSAPGRRSCSRSPAPAYCSPRRWSPSPSRAAGTRAGGSGTC